MCAHPVRPATLAHQTKLVSAVEAHRVNGGPLDEEVDLQHPGNAFRLQSSVSKGVTLANVTGESLDDYGLNIAVLTADWTTFEI